MKSSILARYKKADFSERVFLFARWKLTPYSVMASRLPAHGKILDWGCGHGLLALAAALTEPSRQVIAIDHDAERQSQGAYIASWDLAFKNAATSDFIVGQVQGKLGPNKYLIDGSSISPET